MQRLENGDTVLVPPIGPQVTVEGMVRRPAIYELKDEKNLASVLELAGGLLPTAAVRHIEVQRLVAHDKKTMLSLDIPDASDNAEIARQELWMSLRFSGDGDRIRNFSHRSIQSGRDLSRRSCDASGPLFVPPRYALDGCSGVVLRPASGTCFRIRRNHSAESAGFSSERRELQFEGRAGEPVGVARLASDGYRANFQQTVILENPSVCFLYWATCARRAPIVRPARFG